MTWLAVSLAVTVLALVIVLPGLLIASLLGFRGLWLPGLSVAAGVSVLAIAATVAPIVGLRWGILPVAIVTVVLAVLCIGLRQLFWRGVRVPAGPRLTRGAMLALAAGVLLIAAQVVLIIRVPNAVSQTFDNIFHLNAIRFALDTGSASPLTLGLLTSSHSRGLPFYPSAWHAAGSLVVELTGVSIPVASNAVTIFFAAVWPLSAVLLVRALFGARTALIVSAVAVSAGLPSFPILPLDYGVLFPFMLSVSMLGTALALLYTATETAGRGRWAAVVALLGIVPGIVISHPGGFVALLAFGTLILGWRYVRFLRETDSASARGWVSVGAVGYLLVSGVAWNFLRPPVAARTWVPEQTTGQAIGEVLSVSGWHGAVNYTVSVALIIGIVVAVRRRTPAHITALLLFASSALLYVVVSALPDPWLRDLLTGAWYNNSPRLAALLPIGWIPLAALGLDAAWTRVSLWLSARRPARPVRILLGIATVLVLLLPQLTVIRGAISHANFVYTRGKVAPLVSADEWALLSRLDREVPKDAVIIGNPWTGTALAYAIADRQVLLPHTLTDITPEMTAILNGLNKAAPGSKACAAVTDLNVTYVLDFGGNQVNSAKVVFSGLKQLSQSPNVTLVDSQGKAALYRITGCQG